MPLFNPVLKFISHPMNSFRCQPAMANLTLRGKNTNKFSPLIYNTGDLSPFISLYNSLPKLSSDLIQKSTYSISKIENQRHFHLFIFCPSA